MEKIFFDKISKKFDGYFLEFNPASTGQLFAHLTIIFVDEVDKETIIKIIESLTEEFYNKYPISIMSSAFDKEGDLISLDGMKNVSHYTIANSDNKIIRGWNLLKDEDFSDGKLTNKKLIDIYSDINFRTSGNIEKKLEKESKDRRIFKRLVIFWAVFVPLIIAILEFYSPEWIAVIVLGYSFWKAYREYGKVTGKRELSKREKEKEEKQREMEHFYYHCKKNPDGFLKLKVENFKKESSNRIVNEYNSLNFIQLLQLKS